MALEYPSLDSEGRIITSPNYGATGSQSFFIEGSYASCPVDASTALPVYRPSVPTNGAVTFTGSGLDDLTVSGTYTGGESHNYIVKIASTGTPDVIDWSDDGGSSWITGVSLTGSAIALSNGVQFTIPTTTGHTQDDQWAWTSTDRIQMGLFGIFFSTKNNELGDTAKLEVVDTDGILYPPNTVLGSFHKSQDFVVPMNGAFQLQVNYKKDIYPGLYLRFTYNATAVGSTREVAVNYFMLESTT